MPFLLGILHAFQLSQFVKTLMILLAHVLGQTFIFLFVEKKPLVDPNDVRLPQIRPDAICMLLCFFFTLTRLGDANTDLGVRIIDAVWICVFLWQCAPFKLPEMSCKGCFMAAIKIFVAYELALVLRKMASEADHHNDMFNLKVCLFVLMWVYIACVSAWRHRAPEKGCANVIFILMLCIIMDGVEVYAKKPADTLFAKNIIGIVSSLFVGIACQRFQEGIYWTLLVCNSAHVSVAWCLCANYYMSEPLKVKAGKKAKAAKKAKGAKKAKA
jgi:hypothetical protein